MSQSPVPSVAENPEGFHARYRVTKADGSWTDPAAAYFVLRLDSGGDDPEHIAACRAAARTYIEKAPRHLDKMAFELGDLIDKLDPPAAGKHPADTAYCQSHGWMRDPAGVLRLTDSPDFRIDETPSGLVVVNDAHADVLVRRPTMEDIAVLASIMSSDDLLDDDEES